MLLLSERTQVARQLIVDIADCKVTADPEVELITYSLGSCIGVAIWDKVARVGGMLHYMLPDSHVSPAKAEENPDMFANTGIPRLFKMAYALGAEKHRLVIKIAGGATLFQTSDRMNIGKHNYVMLRKIFWRNRVLIDGEHVGGSMSRTMRLNIETGAVTVENKKTGRIAV